MANVYLLVFIVMVFMTVLSIGIVLLIDWLKRRRANDLKDFIELTAIPKMYDEMEQRMDGIMEKTFDASMKMMKKASEQEM